MLLANNVCFTVAMAAVCWARSTLFLDAMNMGKISVGPPYFDTVFFRSWRRPCSSWRSGPVASWKRAALPELWARLALGARHRGGRAIVIPFAMGRFSLAVAAACGSRLGGRGDRRAAAPAPRHRAAADVSPRRRAPAAALVGHDARATWAWPSSSSA
jgi:hypothetical protein